MIPGEEDQKPAKTYLYIHKVSLTISGLSLTAPKISLGLSPHVLFISLTAQSFLEWLTSDSIYDCIKTQNLFA